MGRKSRILRLVLVLLAFSLVTYTAVYSLRASGNAICRTVQVQVKDSALYRFVTPRRVKRYLQSSLGELVGLRLDSLNTYRIEQLLEKLSGVREAQAYSQIDGTLRIELLQRNPLFRVIDRKGNSYYIDKEGYSFPMDRNYSAHVIVVSGSIPERPSSTQTSGRVVGQRSAFWDSLYGLLKYIQQDALWRNLFCQVYIANENRVELIPRVGGQIIVLGTLDNYEYKLNKLWSYYRADLALGVRDSYKQINLAYGNQVVCSRSLKP